MRNVTYHNPIHQEENTPLVTILEVRVDLKQATAVDSRKSPYNIDLSKASFGGTFYPKLGSQWYLKKISGVWTLMARAPQQNPQLKPSFAPVIGDSYIGSEGTTHIVGDLDALSDVSVVGDLDVTGDISVNDLVASGDISVRNITASGNVLLSNGTKQVNIGASGDSAAYASKLAAITTVLLSARVTTDTVNRFQIAADGKAQWGTGATLDTNLYRNAAGVLKTDTALVVVGDITAATGRFGGSSGDAVFIGDDAKLVDINIADALGVQSQTTPANGAIYFGSGLDTNVYRSSSGVLRTDGTLRAVDVTVGTRSLPRGLIARFVRTANKSSISTLSGLVRGSVTLDANRTYRIFSSIAGGSTVNEIGNFEIALRGDTTGATATTSTAISASSRGITYSGSGSGNTTVEWILTTSGSVSLSVILTMVRLAGTGTFTASGNDGPPGIFVEDIGPSVTNTGSDQ